MRGILTIRNESVGDMVSIVILSLLTFCMPTQSHLSRSMFNTDNQPR